MKKILTTIISISVSSVSAFASVLITNFTSTYISASSPYVWNSANKTLTGTNDAGSLQETFSAINLLTNTQLSITASSVSSSGSGAFILNLYDGFNYATADFNYQEFVGGATVTKSLTIPEEFNAANVTAWFITPNGSPDYNINITFSSMSAVPEPSSALLLGLGAAGLYMLRRRKAA